MPDPRWLADEMLGRLARYLRFLGFDTAYARGRSDPEIERWAARDGRLLLTRDRALAARVPGSVLLSSGVLDDQLRTVRAAAPGLAFHVAFTRCTECNGALAPVAEAPDASGPHDTASGRAPAGARLYRCTACGHVYWDGSHTAQVRARLARVFGSP